MNDENEDANPWDDDESGRTLATDSPSFELPSNVPSPITVPPPAPKVVGPAPAAALAPKNPQSPAKATLVGLMPADFIRSLPRAPSSPAMPASAPVLPEHDEQDEHDDQDDAPTMMGAAAPSHASSTVPPSPVADELVMDETEDATRALPRETFGLHQDAYVVVGRDAVGDDATLAIASGVDLAQVPGGPSSLGPPLTPQMQPQPPQQQPYPSTPYFPVAPPQQAPPQQAAHLGSGSGPWQAAPPQSNPMPWSQPSYPGQMQTMPQPMAPPLSQGMPQPPPQAMSQPLPQPMAHAPPQPWMPQTPPHGQPYSHAPQPPPSQQLAPPPSAVAPAAAARFQLTPQIMVLAGVGVVCLAIFVIGIVLFVTTRF